MKRTHNLFRSLLLFSVCTGFIACGLGDKGQAVNVKVQIDMGAFLRSMSVDPSDSVLNRLIAQTDAAAQKGASKYFDVFSSVLQQQYPKYNLAKLFVKENDNTFYAGEQNGVVISTLENKADVRINFTIQTINARLKKLLGTAKTEFDPAREIITVTFKGAQYTERVRALLRTRGSLQFCEAYSNEEMYYLLAKLDAALAPQPDAGDEEKPEPGNGSEAAPGDGDTGNLKNYVSSDRLKSLEQKRQAKYPVFNLLQPNATASGLTAGPVVGYVNIDDTEKLTKILSGATAMKILPPEAKFIYGHEFKQTAHLPLYAIRITNGEGEINSRHITKAENSFTLKGTPDITIEMNVAGTLRWRRMTRKNIGHFIAIVLDNEVYSCPRVADEISGGRTEISGGFSTTQAMDLANAISNGELDIPLRMIDSNTH